MVFSSFLSVLLMPVFCFSRFLTGELRCDLPLHFNVSHIGSLPGSAQKALTSPSRYFDGAARHLLICGPCGNQIWFDFLLHAEVTLSGGQQIVVEPEPLKSPVCLMIFSFQVFGSFKQRRVWQSTSGSKLGYILLRLHIIVFSFYPLCSECIYFWWVNENPKEDAAMSKTAQISETRLKGIYLKNTQNCWCN